MNTQQPNIFFTSVPTLPNFMSSQGGAPLPNITQQSSAIFEIVFPIPSNVISQTNTLNLITATIANTATALQSQVQITNIFDYNSTSSIIQFMISQLSISDTYTIKNKIEGIVNDGTFGKALAGQGIIDQSKVMSLIFHSIITVPNSTTSPTLQTTPTPTSLATYFLVIFGSIALLSLFYYLYKNAPTNRKK